MSQTATPDDENVSEETVKTCAEPPVGGGDGDVCGRTIRRNTFEAKDGHGNSETETEEFCPMHGLSPRTNGSEPDEYDAIAAASRVDLE